MKQAGDQRSCSPTSSRLLAVPDQRTLWRRILIYTYRFLGIAFNLLFVAWFGSGIVLMYVGMPDLDVAERLTRLPPLDLSTARTDVSEAVVRIGVTPRRILIGMQSDRPVYRFNGAGGWITVYADTGEVLDRLTPGAATEVARRFAPEHTETIRYDIRLTEPDQWTLQSRMFFPLHRVALGDRAGTVVYVSERTGEAVMKTTAPARRWAYVGAVLHWLYSIPLRSQSALWRDLVIWLSIVGCILCLSGLLWGIWRVALSKTYRLRAGRSHSPYAGLMQWYHYSGLVFGVFTFTWVFSGGLSMESWNRHPETEPTRQQSEVVAGGALRLGPLTTDRLRAGAEAIAPVFAPRELEVVQFLGDPYLLAVNARRLITGSSSVPTTLATALTDPFEQQLVSVERPDLGVFERFDDALFDEVTRAAMPSATVVDATWLRRYDSYYYDRNRLCRLPVLRVQYGDAVKTWLYFDPHRGVIARKEERSTRLHRWLYHGLYSFDFPFLYDRPRCGI
jgi:hypothetical protein